MTRHTRPWFLLVAAGLLACSTGAKSLGSGAAATSGGGSTGAGGLAGSGTGGSTGLGNATGAAGCEGGETCGPACPEIKAPFSCSVLQGALSCGLPKFVQELRASNDHVYLLIDTVLYAVRADGLQELLDVRLPPGNAGYSSLQVEEPYLYIAQANSALPSQVPPPKQPLFRRLLDGSDSPSVIWDCSNYTYDFVLDGNSIITQSSSGVLRMNKGLNVVQATQLLPSGFNPGWGMAVDDSSLYWASNEGILRSGKTSDCTCGCAGAGSGTVCPAASAPSTGPVGSLTGAAGSGGGPTFSCAQPTQLLPTPTNVSQLLLDAQWVYYVSADKLFRVAKTGGTPEMVLGGRASVLSMTANATDIFLGVSNPDVGGLQVLRMARGGREATVIANKSWLEGEGGLPLQGIGGLAATADAAYVLYVHPCSMTLQQIPLTASPADGGS